MKRIKILLVGTIILSLWTLSSCKPKNNSSEQDSSSSYIENFNDDRAILTYHEETDSYSFRMNPLYRNSRDNIIVPNFYKEKKVTEVEENAFKDYEYVNKIIVSDNVNKIGKGSLSGCLRIQELTLPFVGETKSTNPYIGYLFNEERYTSYSLIPPYLSKITLTNATSISDGAFYGLEALNYVSLNDGINRIGKDAFNRCKELTHITLPNSVSYIGDYAFKDCENLTSIYAPDSIEKIGEEVFNGCVKLNYNYDSTSKGYYLGNGKNKYLILVNIASDCTILNPDEMCKVIYLNDKELNSLETINITKNIKDINITSSNGWKKLSNVSVHSDNTVYDSRNNCNAIIESSTNRLIFGTKNTRIPKDVVSISSNAFQDKIIDRNPSLKTLVVPNSVNTIEDNAFEGCIGLGSITLSSSMDRISDYMFNGCENLHIVVIPKSIDTIGNNAFNGCYHLETLYFGCSNEEYNEGKIHMDKKTSDQLSMVNKVFGWKSND